MNEETIQKFAEFLSLQRDGYELPNGKKGFVVPDRHHLKEVGPLEDPLLRITQEPAFYDERSFRDYINRFKSVNSQIFAAPGFLATGAAYFICAIDYHKPNEPDRLAHKAVYRPRYSDEWRLWMHTQGMNQAEFSEFIEENRQDIVDPSAASLLDLIRNFKASRKINYDKVLVEQTGGVNLTYQDETEATGSIEVPEKLKAGIPVFFNGPRYSVDLWVRYRVGNGQVSFSLKPDRADIIENDAFNELAKRITEETEVPYYLGAIRTG